MCLAGIGASFLALLPAAPYTLRGQTDFMDLYAGGKLAFTGSLYNYNRVQSAEMDAEGMRSPTRLYMRLPSFALFYRPFTWLPYKWASALWETFCIAGAVAFAWLWPTGKRWRIVAVCWSLPLAMATAEGQDLWVALVAMAVAARLMRCRPFAAGLIASLCLIKFHLFLLVPIWIVVRRLWRFGGGVVAGGALCALLSFVAGGFRWPLDYLTLIRTPGNNPYTEIMPNLHSLFSGLPRAGQTEILGAALVAILVIAASRSRRAAPGLAAALVGGLLVAPHVYMADCALMIPALLLCSPGRYSWALHLRNLALSPIPWLFLMVGVAFPGQALLGVCVLGLAIGQVQPPWWSGAGTRRSMLLQNQ